MPAKVKIRIAKGAGNIPGLLSLFTPKQLKISKSYYNKVLKRAATENYISEPLKNKLIKLSKNLRGANVPLFNNTIFEPKISKYAIKKVSKGTYIWVKFKLHTKGRDYWQSFTIPSTEKEHLRKRINNYIKFFVKKYDLHPVYINAIQLQSVQ